MFDGRVLTFKALVTFISGTIAAVADDSRCDGGGGAVIVVVDGGGGGDSVLLSDGGDNLGRRKTNPGLSFVITTDDTC